MEVRIIDDGGEVVEVPPQLDTDGRRAVSRVGEIWIRGETVFAGYLQRDGPLLRDDFSADNFFRTGDVGFFDGSGYVTVCDRAKDMVCACAPPRCAGVYLNQHMHAPSRPERRFCVVERTCTAPRLRRRCLSTAPWRRQLSLACPTRLWARQSPVRGADMRDCASCVKHA